MCCSGSAQKGAVDDTFFFDKVGESKPVQPEMSGVYQRNKFLRDFPACLTALLRKFVLCK